MIKEDDFYRKLGGRIHKARRELKFSQTRLSEAIGQKSSTYIALIEAGKRRVSIKALNKIASVLHKPIQYFLDYDFETMTPEEILRMGLQADTDLAPSKKKKVLQFYRFLKHHASD